MRLDRNQHIHIMPLYFLFLGKTLDFEHLASSWETSRERESFIFTCYIYTDAAFGVMSSVIKSGYILWESIVSIDGFNAFSDSKLHF